jgi:hypothetical protein
VGPGFESLLNHYYKSAFNTDVLKAFLFFFLTEKIDLANENLLFGDVDSVAQLVEQRPFKAWVQGSNPC